MNEHEFLRASLPAEVVAASQERLFDTNLPMLQGATDAWDSYRMPEMRLAAQPTEIVAAIAQSVATEPGVATELGETIAAGANQSVQGDTTQSHEYIRASTNNDSQKKDEPSNLLVVGVELAAAALLVRFGLKHFAKNGARAVGEVENLTSGVSTKLSGLSSKLSGSSPKSFTHSPIIDAPSKSSSIIDIHPLPRIRTKERDSGPLRVG